MNGLCIVGPADLGNAGLNAAVANAVHHATGLRVQALPIRLEKPLDPPAVQT